jgi:hypothetical protein
LCYSIAAAQNLERLLLMLDLTQDREQLLKAEILRELGRFDEAEAVLSRPFPELNQTAIRCILDLSRQHIRELRQLPNERTQPS